jgi:hypothetical protein
MIFLEFQEGTQTMKANKPFNEKSILAGMVRTIARALPVVFIFVLFTAVSARAQETAEVSDPQKDPAAKISSSPQTTANATPFVPLTGKQRLRRYGWSFVDPRVIFTTAASAAISQAEDHVPEWGQGAEGFGKRFANSYGIHVVSTSIRQGLDAVVGYDPRYWPSESHKFGNRVVYAVSQVFRNRDNNGNWRVAYPIFAGNLGSGFISRTWHPSATSGVSDALSSAGISFGFQAATNVVKEFIHITR